MSTASTSAPRSSRLRAKYLLFGGIALMMAYVLRHNESFLIDRSDPFWAHIQSFKWWLLPHALAGACALILAPLQFSDRIRQRYTKLHRVIGRIYISGALILAPLGAYIQYFEERLGGSRSLTVATAVDAILLASTAAIALFSLSASGKSRSTASG